MSKTRSHENLRLNIYRTTLLILISLLAACDLLGLGEEPEDGESPLHLDEYPWAQAGYTARFDYEDDNHPDIEGSLRIRIVEERSDLKLWYDPVIPEHGDIPAQRSQTASELLRTEDGLEFPRYSSECPLTPNWLFLPYEIDEGKSWEHLLCDTVRNSLEVIATDLEVEVPAGTFETFVVRESWGVAFGLYRPGESPGTVIDTYYNRDVGPVKIERRDSTDGPVIDAFLLVAWELENDPEGE